MELATLFYLIDEFCKEYEPIWQQSLVESGVKRRNKPSALSLSEILTITVYFHMSGYRMFKWYYCREVLGVTYMHSCFPGAVSYTRFLELMSGSMIPCGQFLMWLCANARRTGIQFIDSTSLVVCSNLRINQHKVFKGIAARGKTSEGWFFGFKLHIVINDKGELLSVMLTPGQAADNSRQVVIPLAKGLHGKLFADRGYISKDLFMALWKQNLQLVTGIKRNMKNKFMLMEDKLLLRKRFIIETVNDHLKNNEQIEHSRHRSLVNYVLNTFSGLIAYQLQPKKPSLKIPKCLGLIA